jgi:hypothetical protein
MRAVTFCGLAIIFALSLLAVDGAISPAAAVDRWVGTFFLNGPAITFTVLVNPGGGATWEWRRGSIQFATGPLQAGVLGSQVRGTLIVTGGVIAGGTCCRPCDFTGTLSGNRFDGALDADTCGATAPFTLIKQ